MPLLALLAWLACVPPAWAVSDNFGLGPFEIRNQFPVALPYLNYVPEQVQTLPDSGFRFSYQYSLANTFINTQYAKATSNPVISQGNVTAGLTAANFPAQGYGAYIEMESALQTFRFRYGLAENLELGLDQSWVSFAPGTLDNSIQGVETAFNGVNQARSHATQNQFHYFLAKDGTLLAASEQSFGATPMDPVWSLKWNWSEGGKTLPAVSLKLSYKSPLDSAASGPRSFVSSGHADTGTALLFSKSVGSVVAHFQYAQEFLSIRKNTFASNLNHKLFGLEFRASEANSFLFELMTQSSIFHAPTTNSVQDDFQISRPTDVVLLGFKHKRNGFLFNWGIVEDINSEQNETDVIVFMELGWEW